MGCVWMLEELEGLLERARSRFWTGGDRLRMIRLLGRNPAHSIDDRRVAEVFAASYAIHPAGEPYEELECDMGGWRLPKYVKEVHAMWPDLSREGEKEKARQSLVDIVQTEIERIRAIAEGHKQNAGEDAARSRALKAFDVSPTAETIRKSFIRAKSSVERGIAVIRKETKARKADSDAQGLPPVPGKDISPYDGRPAAWWRESVGGSGRRAEGGGRRTEGGKGLESLAECSGGGAGLETGAAHVQVNRETQADDGRSVAATSNDKGRGWDSVVVEESDIVACGGYLPERYIVGAGDGDGEAESAGADPGAMKGLAGTARR